MKEIEKRNNSCICPTTYFVHEFLSCPGLFYSRGVSRGKEIFEAAMIYNRLNIKKVIQYYFLLIFLGPRCPWSDLCVWM